MQIGCGRTVHRSLGATGMRKYYSRAVPGTQVRDAKRVFEVNLFHLAATPGKLLKLAPMENGGNLAAAARSVATRRCRAERL